MGQQFGLYFLNIQMQVNFNFRKYNYILKENHKLFQNRIVIWHSYWFFFFLFRIAYWHITAGGNTTIFNLWYVCSFSPCPLHPRLLSAAWLWWLLSILNCEEKEASRWWWHENWKQLLPQIWLWDHCAISQLSQSELLCNRKWKSILSLFPVFKLSILSR